MVFARCYLSDYMGYHFRNSVITYWPLPNGESIFWGIFCEAIFSLLKCLQSTRTSLRYIDVIMTTMESQITSLTVVYSTVYSDADERKHQSSASLAFVWGIHRHRWIPCTKGQLCGKCFHLMTSSWCVRCRMHWISFSNGFLRDCWV